MISKTCPSTMECGHQFFLLRPRFNLRLLFATTNHDVQIGPLPPMSQAVIIVDDAGEYRDTLVRLLHHQTYQVILASDVDEALDGLWANGARVKAIYVSGRMLDLVDLTALMEVLDRDWPKVAVITTPRVDETVGRQFERVLLVPEHAEAAVIASTLLGGSHSGGKFSH